MFEKAFPSAKIFCIEPAINRIKYKSSTATYCRDDFFKQNWSNIDKDNTLVFFDDHQNAFERVKYLKQSGFKHAIFEDNYPPNRGDCYSLKTALLNAGFEIDAKSLSLKRRIFNILTFNSFAQKTVLPNSEDSKYLIDNLKIYYEFPPIFKTELTRFGDKWNNDVYPTQEPIFKGQPSREPLEIFYNEATSYTWICYVQI